jgi:P-type Ca2+ transporter type 2C
MDYRVKGLTEHEVETSRQKHGSNRITTKETESFLEKYIGNFKDPIIVILVVALIINVGLAFLGYAKWYEGVGIAIAVLLATLVATFSEYKNESSFQKLQEEASRINIKVFRNGHLNVLNIEEIVTGDYVLLQPGDMVPADSIVISGEISVSQAVLTGEPDNVSKCSAGVTEEIEIIPDDLCNPNTVFRGTVITEGEALVKVLLVGDKTIYGKMAGELSSETRDSPLQVKLGKLALGISKFGYIGATFIAFAFMFKKIVIDNGYVWNDIVFSLTQWQSVVNDLVTAVILAIIIVVVAVPEGLPMMIAIVLSLNMRKLLNVKVLVRKLIGIETSGSLNILFVDKTGTITHGQLEAVTFLSGDGITYDDYSQIPDNLRKLLCLGVNNNHSCVINNFEGGEETVVGGNPTERSLLRYVGKDDQIPQVKVNKTIPFTSDKKYSLAQVEGDVNLTLIKGAPEVILENCGFYYSETGEKLEIKDMQLVLQTINNLSERAMRVIAVAVSDLEIENIDFTKRKQGKNHTLVGFVGIRDDLRKESAEAMELARKAGIQVVMVTGDRRETAVAIARECGMLNCAQDMIFSSREIKEMTDEQLKEALPRIRVIERALPTDKSRLVNVAQEIGLVVGMTGDGVNDAAALHRADVGFAMGSGTEVAKEAADIVIMDDNFFSITKAVHYGRTIYNSIRKFIVFQLTVNVAAILIAFLGPFFGYDLPLTMIQLLWVNLVMDTLAALAFGGEVALEKYMKEKPKRRDESIISRDMWSSILTNGFAITVISLIFLNLPQVEPFFHSREAFLTAFFTLFIFLNNFNKFNARTEGVNLFDHILENKGFLKVVGLIFVVQIVFTYIGGDILRTTALLPREWIIVTLVSLVIIPVDLARKIIRDMISKSSLSSTVVRPGEQMAE